MPVVFKVPPDNKPPSPPPGVAVGAPELACPTDPPIPPPDPPSPNPDPKVGFEVPAAVPAIPVVPPIPVVAAPKAPGPVPRFNPCPDAAYPNAG